MITLTDEQARQVREALADSENGLAYGTLVDDDALDAALAILDAALAQPEQDCQYAKDVAMPEYRCVGKCQYAAPVAQPDEGLEALRAMLQKAVDDLNAAPVAQPLTSQQISELWTWAASREAERTAKTQQHAFARAIERAHGIGGKA